WPILPRRSRRRWTPVDLARGQRQVSEFPSGARARQLQHAAIRGQNQLSRRYVAERLISASYQGFDAFDFVLADIDDTQHHGFAADGAQDGNIQRTCRPLDRYDVQPGPGQPRQDIAVIVLIRFIGDSFSLQRLVRITTADMHHERRPAIETREAALERLQSPRLRGGRISEQDRIVELNDLAA